MQYLIGDKGVAANELISKKILSNEVFALSRMGLAEVRWVDWFIRGGLEFNCDGSLFSRHIFTPTLRDRLKLNGVYGGTEDYFMTEYIKGIKAGDLQVFWFDYDGKKLVFDEQVNIMNNYSIDSVKIDCESLCPYMHTNFWSKSLNGKKVLIVYPFVDTIEQQYVRKNKIWTDEHSGKLPDFELITYKPFWSIGGKMPHSSWKETFEKMRDDISKIDFDIAILGCSHYGLPLVAHIKEHMKKTAIYMGGELQILFGIKGQRWDNWERVNKHYNDHWTRSIDEKPDSYNAPIGTDDGCYW